MKKDIYDSQVTVRLPKSLLQLVHLQVAKETILRGKRLSINDFCVELIKKGVGMEVKPFDVPLKKKGKK